jgi:OOP family OmpA-OmpF porin
MGAVALCVGAEAWARQHFTRRRIAFTVRWNAGGAGSPEGGRCPSTTHPQNIMKTVLVLALSSALMLAATGAHAEGLYVGGALGQSHDKSSDSPLQITDHSSTGGKLWGGYAIDSHFGVEAGYADLGSFGSATGDAKASGLFVDGVGTLPLGHDVSALARVGTFHGKLRAGTGETDTGTNLKVGAGLQYDLAKNVGVRGEWERYRFDSFGTRSNDDLYSIGVNYRF